MDENVTVSVVRKSLADYFSKRKAAGEYCGPARVIGCRAAVENGE